MRELRFSELERRLESEDISNLLNFTMRLRAKFEEHTGIALGSYLVGSCTYSEKDFNELFPPGDMDIIIAPHDKRVLVPHRKDPWNCVLTDLMNSFLIDSDFKESLGFTCSNSVLGMAEADGREGNYIEYKRPNKTFEFGEDRLPIHMVVNFKSPRVYKIGRGKRYQRTFREAIEFERKNDNSFCLI